MPASCPLRVLADRRLVVSGAAWTAIWLLAFGLVAAIIPNPVFARQIPAEPFAIWTWLLSAPLMGLLMATYTAPPRPSPIAMIPLAPRDAAETERHSSTLGGIAGIGAFLAIGCPVCNKIALLLLGASGAMSVFAPIQPLIGAASLALLVATVAWRLRLRATGGACAA